MKVEVLLFGRPRELAGAARKVVSLQDGAHLADLLRSLSAKYGDKMSNELQRTEALIITINGRHFGPLGGVDAPLKDKDTVTIMPAAVGG